MSANKTNDIFEKEENEKIQNCISEELIVKYIMK